MHTLPQFEDVSSDIQNEGLSAYIQVDRDTAARLGVSLSAIDNALYDAFGQRIVTTIFTQSNQYRVILEASPDVQKSPESLNAIYMTSTTGGAVPLSAIATVRYQSAPLQVSHVGQFPAATISFNRARRKPIRRPCPTRCIWCWRPSSRSTSCWACSMRASSTLSPSCPPCPRPR
jgi:multidrug efflux pump